MPQTRTSLVEVFGDLQRAGEAYREFLRVPTMSVGAYRLAAGATDAQTPHAEDEIYYVLRGRATLTVGGREHPAGRGDLLFVPARVEHRFHSIEKALELLVVFAPAESSETG
jgi:mannose-6-phosphate isomerase-like protein (cupin superfamily)